MCKDLIFTGRTIDAGEAKKIGLVDSVSSNPCLEFKEKANQILENGPIGVMLSKRAITFTESSTLYILRHYCSEKGLAFEKTMYDKVLKTEDRLEGLKSFQEKRRPSFKGK